MSIQNIHLLLNNVSKTYMPIPSLPEFKVEAKGRRGDFKSSLCTLCQFCLVRLFSLSVMVHLKHFNHSKPYNIHYALQV